MISLLKYLKKYKLQVIIIVVLTFLQVIAELFLPKLMADIVNIGIIKSDIKYIINIGLLMLIIAFAGTVAAIVKTYIASKTSMSFTKDLREKLFKKIQSLSPGEFDEIGTSSLITRTTNDITQVQNVVVMGLRMMIRAPIMAIGGIFMAVSKNPGLSSILFIVVIFLGILIGVIATISMPLFKKMQIKVDDLNRVLRERLTGVRVIRAFNRIDREKERFDTVNKDLTDTSLKVNRLMAVMFPMILFLINITTVALIWFGAIRIDAGNLLIGDLMAFIQYAMQILFSLIMLTMIFIMIPRASASAIRINEVLNKETKIKDIDKPIEPNDKFNSLKFEDVCFKYEGAQEYSLKNISFECNVGELTAIVGSTGSGKSTLVNMIPRFFDPCEGRILINDIDIKEMKQKKLRNIIGLVPQKSVLFSGTVSENIKFSDENLDNDRVLEVSRISQSVEFIDNMEGKYDSQISQGGTNISGGQKQRLSIARALASKKEIYIFDDSFSALDFKTDAALRKELRNETKESTIIMVSQRVNTIMNADRIIVLENGKIAGIGTHKELMDNNVVYRDIVLSQMSEEESA